MEIVYEDDFCFIVNKPSDLLVHHSYYARNIEEDSLVEQLRQQGKTAYPVHRLDRKTSGLILFAKAKQNVPAFQALFDEGTIHKKYIALLRGHLPADGTIDSPVKNDRGNYKDALTHYRCLQHIELAIAVVPYETARYSLVEFTPKTGRMHQLRIHANKISHPIIGDPKYGNRHHNHMFIEKLGISQLFLHACSLEFKHPFTNEPVNVRVLLPEFWKTLPLTSLI